MDVDEEARSATGRGHRLPWLPRLVLLGVIGAIAMTAEAGVINWSAILLHDHLSASLRIAALAGFFTLLVLAFLLATAFVGFGAPRTDPEEAAQ